MITHMQLYNYTMQFANRSPFSQHLVPRYSESPPSPKFLNLGGRQKKFRPLQTLHQVSATALGRFRRENEEAAIAASSRPVVGII